MQLDTTTTAQPATLAVSLGQIIARGARGVFALFATVGQTSRRMREIRSLHAMSDAQLARMGLRREDIVGHVFRDQPV